jgi:hypothetical protein
MSFLIVASSQWRNLRRCCFNIAQQFSIEDKSDDEAQLKKYFKLSLFSRSYDIWFARFVIWIVVFFEHEVMFLIKSRLDHRLQNLINLNTLTHLFISIAQNIVVSNIWFKIVVYDCSAMMTFYILSIWLSCFLNAVLTVSLIRLTYDEKFTLRISIKMNSSLNRTWRQLSFSEYLFSMKVTQSKRRRAVFSFIHFFLQIRHLW